MLKAVLILLVYETKHKEYQIGFCILRIKNWLNTMKYNKKFKDERKYENYGS